MTVARPIWLQNLAAYTADEFRTLIDADYAGTGVVRNSAAVGPNGPVAANVLVQPGFVVVRAKSAANGKYLTEITATETVTITANASGNPRIDNIVMEVLDTAFSDGSDLAHVIAVAGTPAGSPVAPTVNANQTLLAQVAVANGFSTIVAGNITDVRQPAAVAEGSAVLSLIPGTLTTPTAGTTPTQWFSFGNVNVPSWATRAVVNLAINGMFTSSGAENASVQIRIGSANGALNQRLIGAISSNRFSYGYSDTVAAPASGAQAVTVRATRVSGTAGYTVDAACLITAAITFLP